MHKTHGKHGWLKESAGIVQNGICGLHDAAQYHYNKTIPEPTGREYISLIACPIDPEGLNIEDHPDENAQRVSRIEKVLSGKYVPEGVFDITFDGAD